MRGHGANLTPQRCNNLLLTAPESTFYSSPLARVRAPRRFELPFRGTKVETVSAPTRKLDYIQH